MRHAFVVFYPSQVRGIIARLLSVRRRVRVSRSKSVNNHSFCQFLGHGFFSRLKRTMRASLFTFRFPIRINRSIRPCHSSFIFPIFFRYGPFNVTPIFFQGGPRTRNVSATPTKETILLVPAPCFPMMNLSYFRFFSFREGGSQNKEGHFSTIPSVSVTNL